MKDLNTNYSKSKGISLLIAMLFFFIIHPIELKGLEFKIIKYVLVYVIPIIYLIINKKYTNILLSLLLNKNGKKYFVGLIILFIWTLITLAVNSSTDFSFFYYTFARVFMFFLRYMFLAVVVCKHKSALQGSLMESFMHYYIISDVLYVISTLVLVSNSKLRAIWFNYIDITSFTQNLLESSMYKNRISICGFAGFESTFSCSISVVFCLYILKTRSQNKYIIYMIFCLIGNFFYGRSGLVVSIICLALYLILYDKSRIYHLIIIFSSLAVIYFGGNYLLKTNEYFSTTLGWALNPVISLIQTGSFQSESFNTLLTMYFVPEMKTIFIGDGCYVDPYNSNLYYMGTDGGYMRLILQGGIAECIIVCSLVLSGICELGKKNKFFFISMLILFFTFEFKGATWNSLLPILMILSILNGMSYNEQIIKNVDGRSMVSKIMLKQI